MRNILHVDNSGFFRKMLKDLFIRNNFNYFGAKTAAEAFKLLVQKDIDIIITALELEGESGEEFIKELNSTKYKDIPVIVLTSNTSIETRKKIFSLGVVDYFPKSASMDELERYMENLKKNDRITEQLTQMDIAVIDDSAVALRIINNILKMNNVKHVDYFINPDDIIDTKKEYDIYIVDIILPRYSGEYIITKIKERNPHAGIIAISSIDNYKTITNILTAGADDYIIKPFDSNVFMARIKGIARTLVLMKELEEKNKLLEQMVITDSLTNLYNHKYIYTRLEQEIKEAKRYKKNVSVIMFDIDHFKSVNDTYGHQIGDEVLVAVSKTLVSTLREIDIVGRYGGEEFVAILPETDLEKAFRAAERVRKNVEKLSFSTEGKEFKITISGGVAEYKNETALQLIGHADNLLYKAKENGRNKICK